MCVCVCVCVCERERESAHCKCVWWVYVTEGGMGEGGMDEERERWNSNIAMVTTHIRMHITCKLKVRKQRSVPTLSKSTQ